MSMDQAAMANRVALVTGVSRRSGIGFAIASRLGQLGASLFIHSWSAHDVAQPWGGYVGGGDALAEELRREGLAIAHAEADFMESDAPRRIVDAATDVYGHVDILVANHAHSGRQSLERMTADEVDRHLLVNVRGTLLLAQAYAAQHDGRPGGRVVMMTSGQHLRPAVSEPAYAASKGAIHQLTQTLSASLIPRRITVNTVNPGPTDTGWPDEEERQAVLDRLPLGRWGNPDDAARLIAWLCTDDAQWVTGQVLNSEGGFRAE